MQMRSMALWESGDFGGKMSLRPYKIGDRHGGLSCRTASRVLSRSDRGPIRSMLRWETCLEIKKQIETGPMSEYHAVLCVLCGMADAAYQRPDGVFAAPVTALKP